MFKKNNNKRDKPPSVSCQTMPSSVTAVPGSHGPRHSGSVMVDALQVPTQASALDVVAVAAAAMEDDPSAAKMGLVGRGWIDVLVVATPLTSNAAPQFVEG